MIEIFPFQDALADAQRRSPGAKPSVLLGNGFSIDYDRGRFAYKSLSEKAELTELSQDKSFLFDLLETDDFESAIEKLQKAAELVKAYGDSKKPAKKLHAKLRKDARTLRRGLTDALVALHPSSAYSLSGEEVQSAQRFLANFNHVYTLNYDLLLYWVALQATHLDTPST
ncbi:MAG: DUF4917 family protein, partial [Promicromonosporaceae bacterium]|nr:DUF4917 family protein [Promicromonosporaceae bacterium]